MNKKYYGILALGIWLIIVCIFMLIARVVNLEIFFVLWLISILIIIELIDARYGKPKYLRYLTIVIAGGILLLGVIVTQKVMVILGR